MMLIVMPFDLVPGVQHSFLADFVVPEGAGVPLQYYFTLILFCGSIFCFRFFIVKQGHPTPPLLLFSITFISVTALPLSSSLLFSITGRTLSSSLHHSYQPGSFISSSSPSRHSPSPPLLHHCAPTLLLFSITTLPFPPLSSQFSSPHSPSSAVSSFRVRASFLTSFPLPPPPSPLCDSTTRQPGAPRPSSTVCELCCIIGSMHAGLQPQQRTARAGLGYLRPPAPHTTASLAAIQSRRCLSPFLSESFALSHFKAYL